MKTSRRFFKTTRWSQLMQRVSSRLLESITLLITKTQRLSKNVQDLVQTRISVAVETVIDCLAKLKAEVTFFDGFSWTLTWHLPTTPSQRRPELCRDIRGSTASIVFE